MGGGAELLPRSAAVCGGQWAHLGIPLTSRSLPPGKGGPVGAATTTTTVPVSTTTTTTATAV